MLQDSISNPLPKVKGTWFVKNRDGWEELEAPAATHPITPPPELPMQFRGVTLIPPLDCTDPQSWIAESIYQMGADQELEACLEWLDANVLSASIDALRAARRPKPPSLKEQALDEIDRIPTHDSEGRSVGVDVSIIRRALEQLDD